MKGYLEGIYKEFRPLVEELSGVKMGNTDSEIEKEVEKVRKYICELLHRENLEEDFGKEFFYRIADAQLEDKSEIVESGYREVNLEEIFKEKKQIKLTWVFRSIGAGLENFSIDSCGKKDRYMKKNFMKLLEILEFSDEAREIFITNEVCRFNAIKNPEDLLKKIYMLSMGSICDKKRTIEKFYEETWDKKFYDLDDVLRLWVKKKREGDMDSEIDFIKYHKTLNLFLKLIPLIDKNNILKTEYQYQKEQNIIRQTMYDYYRKRTLNMSDLYLQEFQEVKLFLEKLGQMIDLVNDDNLGKIQKELLMDKFAEYMDEFLEMCDWFIGDSQKFFEKCSEKDKCIHDAEDFQKLWEGNGYHK